MLYNCKVYSKFVSSQILDLLQKASKVEISLLIIDLLKLKSFIRSEKNLWYKMGFLHSIGKKLDSMLNCFSMSSFAKDFLLNLLENELSFSEIEKIIDFIFENMKNISDTEFVVCTTAFQVSKEDKNSLSSKLESIFGKKVYVEYLVERNISGGCIIEFREYCVDASYQKLFAALVKREIKNGLGWREINVNN